VAPKQKIAIVGAGFAGLSTAMELVRRGFDVDVIADSRQKPASELALGIVSLKGLYRARQPEFAYKISGFFCLIKQLRLLSQAFPEFCLYKRVYEPFFSKLDEEATTKRIYRFDDLLPPSVKNISQKKGEINAFKMWGSSLYSYHWYQEDFLINADKYLEILGKYVTLYGGRTVDKTFQASKKTENGFQLGFLDGSFSGEYHQVILCMGKQILKYSHLPSKIRTSLKASEGYILKGSHSLRGKPFGLIRGGKYMGVFEGHWKYGGFSAHVSDSDSHQNLASFTPLFDVKTTSFGTRILTKKRTPSVEFSNIGEIIVTGLYKNGLQYAPFIAKKVVKKIESK